VEFERAATEQVRAAAETTDAYAHDIPGNSPASPPLLGVAVGLLIGGASSLRL